MNIHDKSVCKVTGILLVLIVFVACESKPSQEAQKRANQVLDQVVLKLSETKASVEAMTPSKDEITKLTTQEVNKIFAFEYKVAEFPSNLSSAEIESALMQLGQERWECFHVAPADSMLRLFCKRRPETYLRFIPRLVP